MGRDFAAVVADVVGKDWQISIEDMLGEGNRVVTWETWSSRERTAKICIILHLSEGKIIEAWNMTYIQKAEMEEFGLPQEI
ncbi:MAG: hypothetical protein HN368_01235 [Spirochaetales bacterium]|nr:hypothetical protein [Spirochaetales bacterium]